MKRTRRERARRAPKRPWCTCACSAKRDKPAWPARQMIRRARQALFRPAAWQTSPLEELTPCHQNLQPSRHHPQLCGQKARRMASRSGNMLCWARWLSSHAHWPKRPRAALTTKAPATGRPSLQLPPVVTRNALPCCSRATPTRTSRQTLAGPH